jgi:hypothetical protein
LSCIAAGDECRRQCNAASAFDCHHGFRHHGNRDDRPSSDGERPDRQHCNRFRSAQRTDIIPADGVIVFDGIGFRRFVKRIGNRDGIYGEQRCRQQRRFRL